MYEKLFKKQTYIIEGEKLMHHFLRCKVDY